MGALDFSTAAAPGGNWPPIVGAVTDEELGIPKAVSDSIARGSVTTANPEAITSWSRYTIGSELSTLAAEALSDSVNPPAWPLSNLAFYVPVLLDFSMTVTKLFIVIGQLDGAGSFDAGIYNSDGSKMTSTGSTATTGIRALQVVGVAPASLLRGQRYFMALSYSSTDGGVQAIDNIPASALRALGVAQEASALPLPATFTRAAMAQTYLPFFGIATAEFV